MTRHSRTAHTISGWLLALLLPAMSAAQDSSGASLTLQAAIDRALAANPTLAAARLGRAVDLAGLAVARERPNPEASVELERETPRQSFALAVPLELGGKRAKRIAVGDATIRTRDAVLAATTAQVRNDVRRAYYETRIADARMTVLRELRDLAQRTRDTAQTRFDAGDAPRLEVVQAELALATAETDARTADGLLTASRARLNVLLGQPLSTVSALSTPMDSGGPVISETALTLAHAGSAELTVLDRQIEEQRARLALARSLRTPDVIPTATLTRDSQPDFTYGWRAGVAITVPIFASHKAGVLVEETTLDQLVAERQATLARIDGEVTAAVATAEAQRLTYVSYRDRILPQAQQVEQLAEDSYRLGQSGIAVLLQALQASRDVRLRSLDAVAQLQTALADLERAIGAPLP